MKNEDIKKVHEEIVSLNDRVRVLHEYLTAHCKVYGHDWRDDGHDSHYSYQKCCVCNAVEKS